MESDPPPSYPGSKPPTPPPAPVQPAAAGNPAQPPPPAGTQPPPPPGPQPPQPGQAYPAQQGGGYPMQQGGGYPAQQGGGYPAQQGGGYPVQQGGGYPMQQGGAYPMQQGGAQTVQPVRGPSGPVIVTGPVTARSFGPASMAMSCPHCQAQISTNIRYKVGTMVWVACGAVLFFGGWLGCCLIPFCINGVKDVEHTCPNCNAVIGVYVRM